MSTCVVIHGTWGVRSDFAYADSLFCRAIKGAVQHDIHFERFEWSGSNSSVARAEAAKKLRSFISGIPRERNPVYIIAHSHGGNVAIEALHGDETEQYVGGVITMGTPFLSSETRRWVSFLSTLPGRMSVYAVLMGLVVASIVAIVGSVVEMFHFVYGLLGALTIFTVFVLAAKSRVSDLLDATAMTVEKAASDLSNPPRDPLGVNLLVIYTRVDEALWWLQQVFSITNLPFVLLGAGLWILGWSTIVALGLFFPYAILRLFVDKELIETLLMPMAISIGLGFALSIVGILAIAQVKLLHRVVGTGESSSLWIDIVTKSKATRLPNIACSNLEDLQAPIANVHGGLWHSKYMRSGNVIDQIATRIDTWHQRIVSSRRTAAG